MNKRQQEICSTRKQLSHSLFPALRTVGRYQELLHATLKERVERDTRYGANPMYLRIDERGYIQVVSSVETCIWDDRIGKYVMDDELEEATVHIDEIIDIAVDIKIKQEKGEYGPVDTQREL